MIVFQLNFFDWFSTWFSDTVTPIIAFFKNFVSSFISLLKMLPTVITTISQSFSYVPGVFNVFLVISLFVLVLYIILGRNAGEA